MQFEIKKCKIGNGLFAKKHFDKNQPVLKFDGKILTIDQVDLLPKEEMDKVFQINASIYLDLSEKNNFFINHSCNPNAGVKIFFNTAFLVAIRDIKVNEEITFDYSTTSSDMLEDWNMNCLCSEWNCRRTISGFSYLNQKEKDYYLSKDLVPKYLK